MCRLALFERESQRDYFVLTILAGLLSLKVGLAERVGREQAVVSHMPVGRIVYAGRMIENGNADDLALPDALQGHPAGPLAPDVLCGPVAVGADLSAGAG